MGIPVLSYNGGFDVEIRLAVWKIVAGDTSACARGAGPKPTQQWLNRIN